jgi:hypothetical protein
VDGKFTMDASGYVRADRGDKVFTAELAHGAALFIAYMNGVLSVGQPLRAGLPRLHALVLERLRNPELLVTLGCWYAGTGADEKKQKQLFEALAGEPNPLKQDADATARAKDTGPLIVVHDESEVNAVLRPARLRSYDDPEVSKLARLCDDEGLYDALAFLASPGCASMMRRIEKTPVPEGGWEQNPAASAPELVKDASRTLGVAEDAAVVYLQTLALPDPTSKNVQRWNDWKPARYAKAVDELVKKKLFVSGKRQRAGREAFLPGGWENLKAPNLPLESWKLALHGVEREGKDGAQLRLPMGHLFLRRPAHELFAEAWGRVQRGDRPAYEAVR